MDRNMIRESLLGVSILVLVGFMVVGGIRKTLEGTQAEAKEQLEKVLRHGIVECYALEGAYPPDIEYMKNNYGIVIDEKKFLVHYEVFASNIMPDFKVIEKN